MGIFKKIFRYQLTSAYFIFSQIIVLFAVFGALQIYDQAFAKEQDRLSSIAKNRIELNVTTSDKKNILSDIAKSVTDGNVVATGKLSTAFLEAETSTRCEVLLQVNEALPYPFVWGRAPGTQESDIGKCQVALGKDKFKYAFERDGTYYVTLNQEEYEVTGVIGSSESDYWDYKIILNINCLGINLQNKLAQQQEYMIELYSNSQILNESYQIIYKNMKEVDNLCNIVPYEKNSTGESTVATTLGSNNIKINWMVYLFCLLNSMIMSVFFIVQRRREMAIKKAFGINNIKILIELANNIFVLSLISFVIFIFLYLIWNYLFIGDAKLIRFNGFNVVITFLAMLLSVVITLLYPVYKVFHMNAAITIGGDF